MNALPHTADLVYRELYFPASAMAEGLELMNSVRLSFLANIQGLEWLGDDEKLGVCVCVCVCVWMSARAHACKACVLSHASTISQP